MNIDTINSILWNCWDPIAIKDLNGPFDEYNEYAIKILSMIEANASIDELYKYLRNVRTKNMKMNADDNIDRRVAVQLDECRSLDART